MKKKIYTTLLIIMTLFLTGCGNEYKGYWCTYDETATIVVLFKDGYKPSDKKAPKKKQSRSFILTLGLVLLVGYFVITIIGLQLSIKDRQGVLEQMQSAYEQQLEQNDRLQAIVDSEDKSDYMEQIAREKLGFIMPNEKVFYDVTPGV